MAGADNRAGEPLNFTAKLAAWSCRRSRLVVGGWVLLLALSFGACAVFPANTEIEDSAPGESGKAFELIQERFGRSDSGSTEVIVFSHPTKSVDDPDYRLAVTTVMSGLRGLRTVDNSEVAGTRVTESRRIIEKVLAHYDVGLLRDLSPFVARNETGGNVTFALLTLVGDVHHAAEHVGDVVAEAERLSSAFEGFSVAVGGPASIESESGKIVEEDFGRALFLNLPITLILLVLAFGALLVATVPLALAIFAVVVASGILALISQAYPLSEVYTEIVLLMGLATGIDYALFITSRYRLETRRGLPREEALIVACGTSGKSVVFAGITVLLAVSGMFLVRNPIFSSLGLAAIIVVAVAILLSVTLLPALLTMIGPRLNRFALPFLSKEGDGEGIWSRISDIVLARPALFAIGTLAVVIALAYPILTLNLGFNGAHSLPDAVDAKRALLSLEENFTLGLTSPAQVVVDAGEHQNVFAPDIQERVEKLVASIQQETASSQRRDAPFGSPIQTQVNSAGDTMIISVPLNADTGDAKAVDAVEHLREDLIPAAFKSGGTDVLVTGATAFNVDFRDDIMRRTPIVFSFVLGLAFIVLLLTFRSIVIPVKAIILNALSVGAAYGLLVLVFQKGWLLEGLLSFNATGIIESWLPLFLFSILFGLSMDYHMFVLGRIKEAYDTGIGNERSVSVGIRATAGTITSAAAIMVAVALIFAFMRSLALKQFGFGLATAILIDATVIRSVLLPASMKLLGDANWYLPGWLGWLPRIAVEESQPAEETAA